MGGALKSRKFLLSAVVLTVVIGFHQLSGWARFDGRINRLSLDLAQPDGLIVTRSLKELPRDILKVPLLKDVLSEDFVFYYEHNEDRLGIAGSLRRIAYEHELRWNDQLLAMVLDEPAEVGIWRDAKGAVEYSLIAITRSSLAQAVQELATRALKDSQLSKAGDIKVEGDRVPVLALAYGRDRSLLIAARGNRVVILSDPGMLLAERDRPDPRSEAVVAKLLGAGAGQSVLRDPFALPATPADHRIALSARYLSFGYQAFFPAIEALRFDYAKGAWKTAARLAPKTAVGSADLAKVLPARPAACAWLPMRWPTSEKFAKAKAAPEKLPALAGTGGVCWYGESALHTPLFVAELAAPATKADDETLQAWFQWMVKGQDSEAEAKRSEDKLWQHATEAELGPYRDADKPYYKPTLARHQRLVLFSPDDRLVAKALDAAARRFPSVADTLPADGATDLAVFEPKALARLVRESSFAALDRSSEPVLEEAAKTHLLPRLAALEKYPGLRLVLPQPPAASGGWQDLEWRKLGGKP